MSQPNELLRPNELSPIDLAYAVDRLIARGTTTAREVMKAVRRRQSLVQTVRRCLADLGGLTVAVKDQVTGRPLSFARLTYSGVVALGADRASAPVPTQASPPCPIARALGNPVADAPIATNGTKPSKRPFRWTPKLRAARKLQGQYIGALRKIVGRDRVRIRAITKKNGVAAGLAAARAAGKTSGAQVRGA